MEPNEVIDLGDEVVDTLTGFSGTVTGRSTYLSETTRLLVQPSSPDSRRMPRAEWIPASRLRMDSGE